MPNPSSSHNFHLLQAIDILLVVTCLYFYIGLLFFIVYHKEEKWLDTRIGHHMSIVNCDMSMRLFFIFVTVSYNIPHGNVDYYMPIYAELWTRLELFQFYAGLAFGAPTDSAGQGHCAL